VLAAACFRPVFKADKFISVVCFPLKTGYLSNFRDRSSIAADLVIGTRAGHPNLLGLMHPQIQTGTSIA
jgi:hypothetical protein